MSKEIRLKQRFLRNENKQYGSRMEPIPATQWPSQGIKPIGVFRSAHHLAQVFDEVDGAVRISVMRTMIDNDGHWLDGIVWDDLMAIKNQIGFAAHWAVEIFPPCDEVVNVANMRHIFVLPAAPSFAWRKEKG